MNRFIIDGIGPFFRRHPKLRANWSKIPFSHLEEDGRLPPETWEEIQSDFATFCSRVRAVGYNGVTLDDLAHLHPHASYEPALGRKIEAYRAAYRRLFDTARAHGLHVYITSDVMFYNDVLNREIGRSPAAVARFLSGALDRLFADFSEIAGVILRIGESDGRDVRGDFRSRLVIRTPRHARALLTDLLPVAERHGRLVIFRTWSVGAYRIGDLMWNRDTFDETFAGLDSPSLVVSMKYGESDFFRYLPLNRHFFRSDHQKLVELQARREYEGCGEFPAFIGGDYAAYRDALREARNMLGIVVWCQTGGWTPFHRLSYLEPAGLWNEINTEVAVYLFRDGLSVEGALRKVYSERYGSGRWDLFLEFFETSERVIKQGLYIREFAQRKLFFRRLRVPPLLTVHWDQILITSYIRKLLRAFVVEPDRAVAEADAAVASIDRMEAIALELGLPVEDIRFQRDTFRVLQAARRYYFGEFSDAVRGELLAVVDAYRRREGRAYTIHLDFGPLRLSRRRMRRIAAVLLRDQRGYRRLLDHVVTLRLLSWLRPALRLSRMRALPDFAHERAMGFDTVLR
jgi:hypothetical protein